MSVPSMRITVGGRSHRVHPGALIGRADTAACRVVDPRVSEAHGLISLRGRQFHFLALRGGLRVDGEELADVPASRGLAVELADGLSLTVDEIELPDVILAVCVGGGAPRELCAATYHLRAGGELVAGWDPASPAVLTSDAAGWTLHADGRALPLTAGARHTVGGLELAVVEIRLEEAAAAATFRPGARYEPLHVVTRHDSVHVFRKDRAPARIVGRPAQAVTALAEFECPVEWWRAAEELWRDDADRERMRRRWDRVLEQLRVQLREHGIREDLVVSDGKGIVELLLLPADRLERSGC